MTLELSLALLRDAEQLRRVLCLKPNAGHLVVDLSTGKDLAWAGSGLGDYDASLVVSALDALAALRHPLTSLAVRHLTGPLPQLSAATLAYLNSCGLSELELQDDSIHRAASDGATNLLRPLPGQLPGRSLADSIRLRGAAMARFACSLPGLLRLSLCCAAFSASDVASLAVLTQLEALTLVGAMECGGPWTPCGETAARPPGAGEPGPAFAAALAYKQLLAGLQRLRWLQLPMAIPAPQAQDVRTPGTHWDSDDDDDINDGPDDCGSWLSLTNGVLSETNSTTDINTSSVSGGFASYEAPVLAQKTGEVSTFNSLDLREIGSQGFEASAYGMALERGGLSIDGGCRPQGSAQLDPLTAALLASPRTFSAGGKPQAWSCRDEAACIGHGDWRFPPQLAELTIPLCSLNGRVFRAACAMHEIATRTALFNCGFGGAPAAEAKTGCSLRTLHVPCSPGYTVWAGSFLNDESDFASLSQLSSLECLHLTLELGASGRRALRRDRLRDCLRNLRELRRLKKMRISETRQPVCFSTRKTSGPLGKVDLLRDLLFAVGGDQASDRGQQPLMPRLPRCGSGCNVQFLPALRWGVQVASPMRRPAPPHSPPTPLPAMPATTYSGLGIAFGCGVGLAPTTSSPVAAPGPGPSLDCLLAHWPALETLVVCGQRAVRSSRGGQTRLVLPASLDELM